MRLIFVSNYINHHQIPFCEEMKKRCDFTFIQTEPMEAERLSMGWGRELLPEYVELSYLSEEARLRAEREILDADVVLFGGCEDESLIQPRIEAGKLTVRYSERVYKEAQWKWISPRGLKRKYHDHTRHRNKPVYLLCSGGYVASDFGFFHAYPGKMFCWGYFPAIREQKIDELMAAKGFFAEDKEKIPYLLWAGRFLDWKHAPLALDAARYLKEQGIRFHMDIVGGGAQEAEMKRLLAEYKLSDCVSMPGFLEPDRVRERMEKADIYLFTSDRNEGWGAVLNEAMNSGCACIADHMIGAVPYLLEDGVNGFIYDDKSRRDIFDQLEMLLRDPNLRDEIGRAAYETVSSLWNARVAAERLLELIEVLKDGDEKKARTLFAEGPCSPEKPRSERRIRNALIYKRK